MLTSPLVVLVVPAWYRLYSAFEPDKDMVMPVPALRFTRLANSAFCSSPPEAFTTIAPPVVTFNEPPLSWMAARLDDTGTVPVSVIVPLVEVKWFWAL